MNNKTLSINQIYKEHEGKVSDKWSLYLSEYDRIFSQYRGDPVRLLEIGIQNGGSLEIWAKYFHNGASFVGCDIDTRCGLLDFSDPRIHLVIGDANTDETANKIISTSPEFDIVIDDGSHKSGDVISSFLRYFPVLSKNGIYIIEDVHTSYWEDYEGGLYYPFSTISFIKRLIDVLNHEHWGIDKEPAEILNGTLGKYGLALSADLLQSIHSVELLNSLCVIRKSDQTDNKLGPRFIAGNTAEINPDILVHQNRNLISPSQESNPWTNRAAPPDEQTIEYEHTIADLSGLLDSREIDFQKTKSQIGEKNQVIDDLTDQLGQKSQELSQALNNNTKAEEQIRALNQQIEGSEKELAELFAEINNIQEQHLLLKDKLNERDNTLIEIYHSKKWRLLMALAHLRVLLIPNRNWNIKVVFDRLKVLLLTPLNAAKSIRKNKQLDLIANSGYFDETWYLDHNPDIARAMVNPIQHYLDFGGFEGRDPCPEFSSSWYLEQNRDVAKAKINPLVHYLLFGMREGRPIRPQSAPGKNKVGVVVVSYNSSLAVRITLASLRRAKNNTRYRLVLVDNASNPVERKAIKDAFDHHIMEANPEWQYISLEENLGFAGGNNTGIEILLKDPTITHICLLNSDVVVPDFWIDRLIQEGSDVTTPLTNRAESIQRIPLDFQVDLFHCFDTKREYIYATEINKINAFAQNWHQAWQGNTVIAEEDITFFCVVLTREILNQVGLLDTKFFPGGYEDNDYCIRVRAAGGNIRLVRDAFIYHFGSASFGQLPPSFFQENAVRNRKYLEDKHQIEWRYHFHTPIISCLQDLIYAFGNNGEKFLQIKYINLHISEISHLIQHYSNEFDALSTQILADSYKVPDDVKKLIVLNEGDRNLVFDWRDIAKEIEEELPKYSHDLSTTKTISQNLIDISRRASQKVYCNIKIVEIITSQNENCPSSIQLSDRTGPKGLARKLLRAVIFFTRLKGVVFFGGYPYPEREKDGYYQRIRSIDTLFTNRWRIYIDDNRLPGRTNWFDIPEKQVLVLRIYDGLTGNWLAKVLTVLLSLRCGVFYCHSVLSINRMAFLLKMPGIKKVIDIHGVVPEEFLYNGDTVNADHYNHIERTAVLHAKTIIVVSGAMREHLQQKYGKSIREKFITIPILNEMYWDRSDKPLIDGKPVVIYAGGLHKWQQVPKMIDAMEKTADAFIYRFYCPNPNEMRALMPGSLRTKAYIEIGSKPYSEILQVYRGCHYGFILREDILVNRVACPTKLTEYIAMGVIPIVDFEDIGDYKQLGMKFIRFSDFLELRLPDESERNNIIFNNLEVYRKLLEIYRDGTLALQRSIVKDFEVQKPKVTCDILVQVDNFLAGGLENVVFDLIEAMQSSGLKVSIVVFGEAGISVDRAQKMGLPVFVMHYEPLSFRDLLLSISPKMVISNYSFHGSEVCSHLNIPIVQIVHNTYMWFNQLQLDEFHKSIQDTSAYIAYSHFAMEYTISRLGVPKDKSFVIPNGIDVQTIRRLDFTLERKRLRDEFGYSDSDFVFLCVAGITHQKNVLGLVRSFHSAFGDQPDVKLALLGPIYEKQLFESIEAFIKLNSLGENIRYLGQVTDALPFYAMADVLAGSPFFEGGPLVLLEALASNLPVVHTKVGFAELFEDHPGIAIVAPPLDIFKYSGPIWELHSNPEFEERYGAQLKKIYTERIKPEIPTDVIDKMDKRFAYQHHVDAIKQIISNGKISGVGQSDSWESYFLDTKRAVKNINPG